MKKETITDKLIPRKIKVLEVHYGDNSWTARLDLHCITCNHTWNADLHGVIYHKRGCPKCADVKKIKRITAHRKTNKDIDKMVLGISPTITRQEDYINISTKILWKCGDCEYEWRKTPSDIVHSKHGCPRCSKRERVTDDVIDSRLKSQGRNIIRNEHSKGTMEKIEWKCGECAHIWNARPNDILSTHKSGCPQCSNRPFSKKAIDWLEEISLQKNVNIQHAKNGGEFIITGTKFRADGFCKETNTIYEFYGNAFHGNPTIFSPKDRCHPYDKRLTANTLYNRTKDRESKIKLLGYNLVTLWESDWE